MQMLDRIKHVELQEGEAIDYSLCDVVHGYRLDEDGNIITMFSHTRIPQSDTLQKCVDPVTFEERTLMCALWVCHTCRPSGISYVTNSWIPITDKADEYKQTQRDAAKSVVSDVAASILRATEIEQKCMAEELQQDLDSASKMIGASANYLTELARANAEHQAELNKNNEPSLEDGVLYTFYGTSEEMKQAITPKAKGIRFNK